MTAPLPDPRESTTVPTVDIALDTDALAQEMRHAVISQAELADKAGISRQMLSAILSGSRGASPKTIRVLAKALRVPAGRIVRAATDRGDQQ